MSLEKRRHFECVMREPGGELYSIGDGWNLGDAPKDFDFAAFRERKWELIEAQPNPLGDWITVYDRTGHIYGVERPESWKTSEVAE